MNKRFQRPAYVITALVLILSVVAVSRSAVAASPATITIHKLVCPVDFSGDIYAECHDQRLAYVEFDVKGQNIVTDENGEVSTDVMYGSVPITEDATTFYSFEGAYVYCTEQTTSEVLFDNHISDPLITIQTDPGAEVICDWYNLAGDGTEPVELRILKGACSAAATSITQCTKLSTPDVEFTVNGDTWLTDFSGSITLDVAPGKIKIAEDPAVLASKPGGSFVRCWTFDGDVLFNGIVKKGGFTIDPPPGSVVTCNVINLPKVLPAPASIVIHKLECPENTTGDIFTACHDNRLPDIDFTINNKPVTTSDKGVASVWLEAGTIKIKEDQATFNSFEGAYVVCSVPGSGGSLFDGPLSANSVTVKAKAGQIVVCDWYNLTPAAAVPATITIHKAACSIETIGSLYDACHDNRIPGIDFQINGKIVTTGGDGVASREVDDTLITIAEDPDVFDDTLGGYVYCSDTDSGDVLFNESIVDNSIEFAIPAGAPVVCDWYNLTN